ncbi:MAG: hypothetical protein SFW65_01965 [Alphaproteobacteria bacterium]|nr:hypothetical protein [Alphaproteobacteria bacterium]
MANNDTRIHPSTPSGVPEGPVARRLRDITEDLAKKSGETIIEEYHKKMKKAPHPK